SIAPEGVPAPAAPEPSSSTGTGGGVTFGNAPPATATLAIDGHNPFLADHEKTDTTADAKHRVEAALRQPARDRERELGLGPEGPVLTAIGEATATTTTPVQGRAVFFAIANGLGEVVSIQVAECDGSRSSWAAAGAIALESLKGKKLRVPSSATRAEM